jgi:DNA-binding response OmpR family regulator
MAGQKETILTETPSPPNFLAFIIEDDPKLAAIFAIALQQANYETEIIPDGQIATQRLAITSPDVVILDLHLPYVSGVDILKQIRADQRLAQTYIIVVTADVFMADSLQGKANRVLVKPISFTRLQNLAAYLQASQSPNPIE